MIERNKKNYIKFFKLYNKAYFRFKAGWKFWKDEFAGLLEAIKDIVIVLVNIIMFLPYAFIYFCIIKPYRYFHNRKIWLSDQEIKNSCALHIIKMMEAELKDGTADE